MLSLGWYWFLGAALSAGGGGIMLTYIDTYPLEWGGWFLWWLCGLFIIIGTGYFIRDRYRGKAGIVNTIGLTLGVIGVVCTVCAVLLAIHYASHPCMLMCG
jgi:hypothetical protein